MDNFIQNRVKPYSRTRTYQNFQSLKQLYLDIKQHAGKLSSMPIKKLQMHGWYASSKGDTINKRPLSVTLIHVRFAYYLMH